MTSVRTLGLALAITAASAVAASAQTKPWPTNAPSAQPQQSPWPASAPAAQPMAAPAGPAMSGGPAMGGGLGMGGPPMPPTAAQQECVREFTALRAEVEKHGIAAKTASTKQVSREEMCKLVTVYAAAETKWIKFTAGNMMKCGIPKQIVDQISGAHKHTEDARKKLCAPGPTQAGPSAPTLSDALGTATLPNRETEKRKAGGTLDTLTGNALAR